jgi:hypothetical protein
MIELQDFIDKNYNELSIEKRQILYDAFKNPETRKELEGSLSSIIFKKRPPTGEEFLDPINQWLPLNVVSSIYPHIREDFLKIIDGKKDYFQLCFYGATRIGKTFLARLLIMYTVVFIHHLREPALYYGLSPLTDLCIYFISFKFEKTRQLYLQPLYKILEKSKRFVKVKIRDQVAREQAKYGCEKIVYSESALVGEITLASGLQFLLGNDSPNEIIGADIIQAYISEIAFFIEEAGATEEKIFQLYTDALDRIKATVGADYLTHVFLDSSANYADSLIENYIIKTLQFEDDVYFKWRSRWEAVPQKFKKWFHSQEELKAQKIPEEQLDELLYKQGKMFKVITGNADIPAKFVTSEQDIVGIPKDLIAYIPIDVKKEFSRGANALVKSIKDIAGKPTSNESKFIQSQSIIDGLFSCTYLRNIEGGLVANAADSPQQLLYNKVEKLLFTKYNINSTVLYRAPREPRIIALDSAHSVKGDLYGFCMGHGEWSRLLETTMVIIDLCFPVLPGDDGINLAALEAFVIDLKTIGDVPITRVNMDTFQSQQTKQNLKRVNIDAQILSVDTSLNPYMSLLTMLLSGTIKAGKNIFLKNNLTSLERIRKENGKEMIDHKKGVTYNSYSGDWENSKAGINAKDTSDPLASVAHTIISSDIIPTTIFEDENRRFTKEPEFQKILLQNAFKYINRA